MKTLAAIILAVGFGFGAAFLFFKLENSNLKENFPNEGWPNTGKSPNAPSDLNIAGSSQLDLGQVYSGKSYTHEFLIENLGYGTGEIWLTGNPPETIVTNLTPDEKVKIEGQSSFILRVTVNPVADEVSFRKILLVQSNSPSGELVFSLSGNSLLGISTLPAKIQLNEEQAAGETEFEVHCLNWLENSPGIATVSSAPQPNRVQVETLPLDPKILEQNPGVKSGHTFRCRILTGDGFNDDFRLIIKTDLDGFEEVEVPISLPQNN